MCGLLMNLLLPVTSPDALYHLQNYGLVLPLDSPVVDEFQKVMF